MVNSEILQSALGQMMTVFTALAGVILAWQLYLFVRENPKKFGFSMKKVALKKKKERKAGLVRWAIGVLITLSSFGLARSFFSVIEFETLATALNLDWTLIALTSILLLVLSGMVITFSSLWKPLRYVGDLLFVSAFVYSIFKMGQIVFLAEANIYEYISDLVYHYLSFFGFLFFVLVIALTVKALTAFDEKKLKLVRVRLEQLLQLGMGLVILIVSAGLIATITIGSVPPESFSSLMLDSEFAVFRYTVLLYLFGGSIFMRQLLPYFRYVLMGLLSLSSAYIVFDVVNYFV
ncbi:MAG: hypothetical protein ACI9QC_000044 [Oceanicoccus sp.]|jgi:hypothetical protein